MWKKTTAIIGGGPAGAMTGERLAHATARVVVFEEKLGWEKPCGGGLSHKALRHYPFLSEAPGQGNLIREAEFIAPNGASVRFELRSPLVIYSRYTLNKLLLSRAEEAGAEVIHDRILHFRQAGSGWELQGRRGTYRADYLVLAAGARTRLRRLLAEDFGPHDFMLTFGYYVPGQDELLRIQFFEDFEGYAWAFSRTDHLSVGICGKVGEDHMSGLRERLHGFMRAFGYPTGGATVFSHLLPSLMVDSWSNLRLAGRNWALVGDAAGLVDPITGEGIYYAMRSGEILAASLLEGSPALYPDRVQQEFGRAMARGARLARLFYRGDVLGEANTTRLIQFAARTRTFLDLLQDLLEGSQPYASLGARLYRDLATALAELATRSLLQALRQPRTVKARHALLPDWTNSHAH